MTSKVNGTRPTHPCTEEVPWINYEAWRKLYDERHASWLKKRHAKKPLIPDECYEK